MASLLLAAYYALTGRYIIARMRTVSQTQDIPMDLVKGEPAGTSVLRNFKFIPKQWLSGFRSTFAGTIPDIMPGSK